jgi:hypothetical protein
MSGLDDISEKRNMYQKNGRPPRCPGKTCHPPDSLYKYPGLFLHKLRKQIRQKE